MLKRVQEQTVEEKEYIFDFETEDTVHRVITRGVNELHALVRLRNDLGEISEDISKEVQSERSSVEVRGLSDLKVIVTKTPPKKKAPAKKVVELKVKEEPVTQTVSNGIVFNQPKVVNNPGFQPKFREEIN